MVEFILANFWFLLFILLLCLCKTPGLAVFTLAIYIVFGSIPSWLYILIAIIGGSIHLEHLSNIWESNKKNNYTVHIHATDKEIEDLINEDE